jgi:hypothetical protein
MSVEHLSYQREQARLVPLEVIQVPWSAPAVRSAIAVNEGASASTGNRPRARCHAALAVTE